MSNILSAIHKEFSADFESGRVFRIASKQRPDLVGREAGFLDNHGYYRISVAGKKMLRSHIIFALAYGRLPEKYLDHINRERTDDRPPNLREADHFQNMWNRTPMDRALPMGVKHADHRFAASIMHRRKQIHLGRFDSAEEASRAYQAKRRELFNEFA